jgi:hypothetical protein
MNKSGKWKMHFADFPEKNALRFQITFPQGVSVKITERNMFRAVKDFELVHGTCAIFKESNII